MVHPLFGPEVRQMLQENDAEAMKAFCETLHPATVAEALEGEFGAEEIWKFLKDVDIRTQATVFEYFPEDWQVRLVEGTGRPHMARLIEQMSHDDRADLLRRLPGPVVESLLRLVDEADRRDIATLVKYEENTAGALMTTEYAWLPEHITAAEALDRLRLMAPDKETIYYVYVLDGQRRLLGVVSLRDLILARRQTLLRDLMERDVLCVRATDDREKVAQEIARYDLLAIPVVDDEGRLVGIVTYDDVIDVVVEEATEDVHRMGAVGPLEEGYLEARFVNIWRKRAFWLALLFVAELGTIQAMQRYEQAMDDLVVLALFVPLCMSIGGNSGSQAVTLITRALALGQVTVGDWLRVLRHELLMGLVLGTTLAVIGFGCAWGLMLVRSTDDSIAPWKMGLVIAQAVACICLWGTLVGSMLPLFFLRVGIDPGVASSPFVATLVDVTGILIYFSIATIYLMHP
jgi:magnesium transporter